MGRVLLTRFDSGGTLGEDNYPSFLAVFEQQKNTLRDRTRFQQMKKHTSTNQKTTEYGTGWGGVGQRRLIATLGYDCGSGGGGRQQWWLAMAGGSRGWQWLVAAPGEDNECNVSRGGGYGNRN
jgi:hypothetical protein